MGAGQACLRMVDASVHCWGSNRLGSAGVKGRGPSEQYHTTPQRVANVSARRLVLIGVHSCFEPSDGGFACWGGQMSNSDARPRPLSIPRGEVISSASTGCVVTNDGVAHCWGDDTSGRLSPGNAQAAEDLDGEPVEVHALAIGAPILTIAIGGRHGCALRRDGTVSCWGLNNFGQLGGDHRSGRTTPEVIPGLDGVVALSSGFFHTCAVKSDRSVWCWGRGDDGQLGIGDVVPGHGDRRYVPVPTKVVGLPPVDRLIAAHARTCAITKQRTLWCWGDNAHGEIGDGTSTDRFKPVEIASIRGVTQVALGDSSTCALADGGQPYCWGDNDDGILGNGGVEATAKPAKVKIASAAGDSAVPGVRPGSTTLAAHESLACGFRFKAPGKRVFRALDDLVVDAFTFEGLGDVKLHASCSARSSSPEGPDEVLARFTAAGSSQGGTHARRSIGGADCVESTFGAGRSVLCWGTEHVIRLAVESSDAKLVAGVIGSLELFDGRAGLRAIPPRPTKPAPAGMTAIAGGELAMGCANESLLAKPIGELGCTDDSQPLHRVRISPFAIDTTEVTIAAYQACVAATKCTPAAIESFRHPEAHPQAAVRNVTWDQAVAYCRWKGRRLPTEAEWERAARGTDLRKRPWGDDVATCDRALLLGCKGIDLVDVGQYPEGASPDGVLDLVGGVGEWTGDVNARTYYLESPLVDPKGPPSGIHRAIRGSSSSTGIGSEAITHRMGREPSYQEDWLGFRCAVSM